MKTEYKVGVCLFCLHSMIADFPFLNPIFDTAIDPSFELFPIFDGPECVVSALLSRAFSWKRFFLSSLIPLSSPSIDLSAGYFGNEMELNTTLGAAASV